MESIDIIVCIVHYNSQDTIECVSSLLIQTMPASITIVDNHSDDDSFEQLISYLDAHDVSYCVIGEKNITKAGEYYHDEPVSLIRADNNNGFAAANNLARQWNSQIQPQAWNLLLNNDTIVPEDFIAVMSNECADNIRQYSTNNIAMGAAEYSYYTKQYRHTGKHYLWLPFGWAMTKPMPCSNEYICGACLLLPPQAPLMDDTYFLYFEDTDFAETLHKSHYKLICTDKTGYYHKVGGTTKHISCMAETEWTSLWHYYFTHHRSWTFSVLLTRLLYSIIHARWSMVGIIIRTYKKEKKAHS